MEQACLWVAATDKLLWVVLAMVGWDILQTSPS
jgi:hypothetical protein